MPMQMYPHQLTIPAASYGVPVYYAAIDSRGETCSPFIIPFGDYRRGMGEPYVVPKCLPPIEELRKVLGVL